MLSAATQKAAPMTTETQNVGATPRPVDILATLRQASARTGSDFDYLLSTAMRESSLQPQAKSKHSSATGLFQFIDQTWLGLVKRYGERHGLAGFAAAIEQKPGGGCSVASAEVKSAILALRKDPELSALMAGEAARESKAALECAIGRDVTCGELYAAHFLGQGGARKLLSLYDADPGQRADLAFPAAAKANRSVFYRADGAPKSIGELYSWVVKSPAKPAAAMLAVSASTEPSPRPAPSVMGASVMGASAAPEFAPRMAKAAATQPGPVLNKRAQIAPHPFVSTPVRNLFSLPSLPQAILLLTPALMDVLASASGGERAERKFS
jgi:hypothetical protein